MSREALAAHAVGMTQGDRAAVHVQAVGRDAELVAAVQHLHGEGFVQLPQVDVLHRQAQLLEHLGHGEDGADAHLVGLAARHGEAEEAAQGLEALAACIVFARDDAGTSAVGELARVAGRDHAARQRGLDAGDAFLGRAFARAFVLAHRDLPGDQAQGLVGHAGRDGDRCDLVVELAGGLRGAGLLLAGGAVFVHRVAADVVALGDLFGGLQHAPVDLGLGLGEFEVAQHVRVHFLLHAGDALDAAGDEDLGLARDDALRGHGDGLQARGAETVDRHARGGDGQAGAQRDLARDVGARRALGVGAAHDDVIDFRAVDARALDGVLHGVAAERGAVGHVEGALPALGERRAGGGNDHCGGHVRIPWFFANMRTARVRRRPCPRRRGGRAAARAPTQRHRPAGSARSAASTARR